MLGPLILLVTALHPVDAYNEGNRLYASKDYAGAVTAYQSALRDGPSAAVLYNLGNAEFKAGQVGRAILAYRRAHYLAPRDTDIGTNLAYARAYRADKTMSAPGPLARVFDEGFHLLSHREATMLAALGFLVASLLLGQWIVRRGATRMVGASVCAAVAAYALASTFVWAAEIDAHPAAVIVPEVNALSGPSEDAKEILLLHDGSEVSVREVRGDYVLAALPGGGGGWIRHDALERVFGAAPATPAR